jgi:hypothetical protein
MLPDIQIKQEPKSLFPNRFGYVFAFGLGILLALVLFLFGVVSTDLECTRALSREIQCGIMLNHSFLQPTVIKVDGPLAVDIVLSGKSSSPTYTAEFRLKNSSYRVGLASYSNRQDIQELADTINYFRNCSTQ